MSFVGNHHWAGSTATSSGPGAAYCTQIPELPDHPEGVQNPIVNDFKERGQCYRCALLHLKIGQISITEECSFSSVFLSPFQKIMGNLGKPTVRSVVR